ncbi:phospholipase D-like domain-containing protein [Acidisoma sp. L85]|uniref:phospholipase D-like domain-containing protein n=1 Tax=Acidisoma sp. L85 TaxID=1641850 RepID=UPI001C204DC7|nr:phospholipase D-like domain-containing protein [Acidisoma sp. L85]
MDSETAEIGWVTSPGAIVQPEDGVAPVVALIASARTLVLVKMFTFTSAPIAEALILAKTRGAKVRVMLNPARSSGSRANDDMKALLEAGGAEVAWSNEAFAVTHEKSMVIDGRQAMIATFNFCEKYFTLTRDYGAVTSDPHVVEQVANCFEADWARQAYTRPEGSALLWSNRGSRALMCAFVDGARNTLDVQHPKFVDAVTLDRLIEAHSRGVRVRVLCGGKHGISTWDILDTFASLKLLSRNGAKIRKQKHLRLHAKLLLADGKRALVGSMNIDRRLRSQTRTRLFCRGSKGYGSIQ